MYHESVDAMRKIGQDCIERRIKAVISGDEVPNDILTQMLQGCGECWLLHVHVVSVTAMIALYIHSF